mmetsp:Transcript_39537/g.60380  ORF Transcript_39537/g.60380 Transcript_39537/m.60380 type:complete len:151 (+) Transcript_39537:1063-1515(+)
MQGFSYTMDYSSSSDYDSSTLFYNRKRYFQRIHVKRDNVNNVGNLICFPLRPRDGERETDILIVGGLNFGLLSGKSHIFSSKRNVINYKGELEMPIPDVSKFFYRFGERKVFVVGQYRIQEFDLIDLKWTIKSFGFQQISKQWIKAQSQV